MQRCGYCDRQSDIDHSEDEKEDHGSAQPAPPTKSRFHRLPPISTSRPLSRCHPPPAGVVLPGQIDGHTRLSAPIGSLFTRLRAVGPPRTPPAAGGHVNPADRTQERELGQFQSHPGITKLVTHYDGQYGSSSPPSLRETTPPSCHGTGRAAKRGLPLLGSGLRRPA